MKNRVSFSLHLGFAVIALVELAGRLTGSILLEYVSKPLIMVWMAVFFLIFKENRTMVRAVLMAFLFSWAGDMFLMFSWKNELFFFAGVGGFFLAQITYIIIFIRFREEKTRGFLQSKPIFAILFVLYLGGILAALIPRMEGIMIPVIMIYAVSLIGMSMAALNRKFRVSEESFLPVFAGSVFFVLSDSMIAIDKFVIGIPMAGFWIMITYMTAQYLIMRGLARQH
jgi:uncharacterized membrane protein YhhN